MPAFVFNGPQLHLLVNHIAVIGLPFAALALLYGLLRRADGVLRLALVFVVLCGLGAGASYVTGGWAEDVVEEIAEDDFIDHHEDVATWVALATGVLGLIALGGLVAARGRAVPRGLALGMLAGALAVSGALGYTAHLGGLIRHTEIRDGAAGARAGDGDDHDTDDSGRGRGRGRSGEDR